MKPDAGGKTLIMGIVNVTPDSFSDGGQWLDPGRAIDHALQLIDEGADIIDVGAESTRPNGSPIDAAEEWRRLEPVLAGLCRQVSVPVSVDTYKASIASRALNLGVTIINDIWGGLADPDILHVAAESSCTYIWMHNRERPTENDAVKVLLDEAQAGIVRCLEAGIERHRLWIDPGIGFGKTYEQNLQVLQAMPAFCGLGPPVLLGTSRKSVIGHTLSVPPGERLAGSLATVVLGVHAGVRAVRVHDVRETVQACRMTEAVLHV